MTEPDYRRLLMDEITCAIRSHSLPEIEQDPQPLATEIVDEVMLPILLDRTEPRRKKLVMRTYYSNPNEAVRAAKDGWAPWTRDRDLVQVVPIEDGEDRADNILLYQREHSVFSVEIAGTRARMVERGHWDIEKARQAGIPREVWMTMAPLVRVLESEPFHLTTAYIR